jgi:hypothetical protein
MVATVCNSDFLEAWQQLRRFQQLFAADVCMHVNAGYLLLCTPCV